MIKKLYRLLSEAKKEKAEAMRPFNERIRTISAAIRNLEKFTEETASINDNPMAKVKDLESEES